MTNNIIEQAKRGLEGFAIGGYHTSGNFSKYREDYYKYFGDPDDETRKYAIAAFTCMLGTWETGSLRYFSPYKSGRKIKNGAPIH